MSFGPNILKIAHRGYCVNVDCFLNGKHNDNSIESICNAIKYNFDMIEIDVRLCKTGEIVLIHDEKIKGVHVKDIEYKVLKQLNILTLEDLYNIIGLHKIQIILDIKGKDFEIANKLIQFIRMRDIDLDYLYISSFNRKILHILKIAPIKLKVGFITYNLFTNKELDMITYGLTFICIQWNMIDENTYNYCKQKNIKVFLWTLNHTKYLSDFYKLKNICDGIITDIDFCKL